ncbi:TetR family transcriptional regulator [Nitrospirillum viridazoti Y2]|uniref:TetR family transcriptional regulator n=1 Tax=Nitrospirillum amazonense TaxID=28077 RepID=A0A560I1Y2_9PROT|nr:TetR/AcrR family transcriptional regulator [Nitrospirillum amazonense]EGY01854.1 TetR family transcriptional regulator [Nitrospirillum amazonense Y2]TWB52916.1 TetR family transcriptional regulator [Nitrospirillum amazonense]
MAKKPDISLRKQAKQQRAIATVEAIVEAATYILTRDGPGAFTTQKVVEKAGVNIASFYQYFPNKQALLFHIAKSTWDRQLARLAPILSEPGGNRPEKLKSFLREFFLIEAAEADLRRALRVAAIDLRETAEFQALIATGYKLTKAFLEETVGDQSTADLEFNVDFIVLLTTSFAERTTDQGTAEATLIRQADLIADMLIEHFGIA